MSAGVNILACWEWISLPRDPRARLLCRSVVRIMSAQVNQVDHPIENHGHAEKSPLRKSGKTVNKKSYIHLECLGGSVSI